MDFIAKSMKFEHDFYGSMIREASLGPRRELILRIETWPKGAHAFGSGNVVTLRFGAISNFEEVKQFFATVPSEYLHYLRYSNESTLRRRIIEMEFDSSEDRIKIIAGHVSVIDH